MDTKTGQIYTPEELAKDPPKSLKDLEPLTREEAAFLSDVDPTRRVMALARFRELEAMSVEDIAESLGIEITGPAPIVLCSREGCDEPLGELWVPGENGEQYCSPLCSVYGLNEISTPADR